jgi:hypothetical protein
MKFNLKAYAEKATGEGDIHYDKKLRKDHSSTPEAVTQKQLEKDRVKEKDVTVEKLLDDKRLGGADKLIEKNLDDAKGGLHQHRNTEAHTGDINKVEEQRLANATQEGEKYESASSTPKKKRWWEHLKADSQKRVVTAQELAFDEGDRWDRIDDTWSDEEGVKVEPSIVPDEDMFIEQVGTQPLKIDEIRPVDSPIAKGLYISLDIEPSGNQLGLNELQQAAYDAVIGEGYSYLADVAGFTPEVFAIKNDQMVARLIGDEYYPAGHEGDSEAPLAADSPFTVSDFQSTEVEGVILGTVSVDPEMLEMVQDMDDEQIVMQVRDAIGEAHPQVNVEDDGIDLDKLMSGEINFVGQVDVKKKGRPESWENVKGDPIASNDFDIVVLSDTKKN